MNFRQELERDLNTDSSTDDEDSVTNNSNSRSIIMRRLDSMSSSPIKYDYSTEIASDNSDNTTPPHQHVDKRSKTEEFASLRSHEVSLDSYKYIPLRLTSTERMLLNVLENALNVCEYTDVVDIRFSYSGKSKTSRIFEQLIDVLSIELGLIMASDLSLGESYIEGRTLRNNIPLFRDLFEIGRRYKIMNPSKMRDTYGKMMYILMDTESYNMKVVENLDCDFVKPVLTVYLFLLQKSIDESGNQTNKYLQILSDDKLRIATHPITDELNERNSDEMKVELAIKNDAIAYLIDTYTDEVLTEADVRRVIDSVTDHNTFTTHNMWSVSETLALLENNFKINENNNTVNNRNYSLQLADTRYVSSTRTSWYPNFWNDRDFDSSSSLLGYSSSYRGSGSCLSHDHSTQFTFVRQSLTLWKEIMANLTKLWVLADIDLTKSEYRLVDTGQGYQRLQNCPNVGGEMHDILHRIMRRERSQGFHWEGLSVIHLGDRDVPNALVFIDKYVQIPFILSPLVQCISRIPRLVSQDPPFAAYIQLEWGSLDGLKMQILQDFFKHAFDGSGDDGGSCIDGRLTSAWNWCSKIVKKPYYYVFMFTGFRGFDIYDK